MHICDIPSQFQPQYESHYPSYSSGKNIEEIFFDIFQKYKDNINTDYIYLPVFWTSYYILHNYKDNTGELANWLESLDKSKKYFTTVQFDSGIFINSDDIIKTLDLIVFSAGGGGLNTLDSIRTYNFHGLTREFFNGRKGQYDIPLICLPQFPNLQLNKDIYCSFMGRYDTYFSRMDMKEILKNNPKFTMLDCVNYDTYCNIINRSIFTLAPRGFGFTSFRLYEAIYANSIPVYIWDNEISLPFSDEIKWDEFCVIIHSSKIKDLETILERIDIPAMQEKLKEMQNLFTFKNTANYIIKKIT